MPPGIKSLMPPPQRIKMPSREYIPERRPRIMTPWKKWFGALSNRRKELLSWRKLCLVNIIVSPQRTKAPTREPMLIRRPITESAETPRLTVPRPLAQHRSKRREDVPLPNTPPKLINQNPSRTQSICIPRTRKSRRVTVAHALC